MGPSPLSAVVQGSFAYLTIRDRLPVILTHCIDHLHRQRLSLSTEYGKGAMEDSKKVIGKLSQLKNELQTDKPITLVESANPPHRFDDTEIWNEEYQKHITEDGTPPSWFKSPWLYVECYMYRRVHDAFLSRPSLSTYDPFKTQKLNNLKESIESVKSMIACMLQLIEKKATLSLGELKTCFGQFVEASLWGNRCDLSISAGLSKAQKGNLLTSLEHWESSVLVNDCPALFQFLNSHSSEPKHIGLVLDNAGFELVTDLCLITLLIEFGLATTVSLYTKTRPWFVSDTTREDIAITLEILRKEGGVSEKMCNLWRTYLVDGRWIICDRKFWTTSVAFPDMKEVDPKLHEELEKFFLIIFKGDLNYRKLLCDLDWPTTTPFKDALQGFLPTSLVAIRTAKGGPVAGLKNGVADSLFQVNSNWGTTGDYGMIQLVLK